MARKKKNFKEHVVNDPSEAISEEVASSPDSADNSDVVEPQSTGALLHFEENPSEENTIEESNSDNDDSASKEKDSEKDSVLQKDTTQEKDTDAEDHSNTDSVENADAVETGSNADTVADDIVTKTDAVKKKNNVKRNRTIGGVACILAAGLIYTSSQHFNPDVLIGYGTKAEVEQYKESRDSVADHLYDLFATKSAKSISARDEIRHYRIEERKAADAALAKIYDSKTGVVSDKATDALLKEAREKAAVLPESEQKKYTGALDTVKTELDKNVQAAAAVEKVWKDDKLVGSRDDYNNALTLVNDLKTNIVKGSLQEELSKADTELKKIEAINNATAAVDGVYKDGKLVGSRNSYWNAYKLVSELENSDAKTDLNNRLAAANQQLTAQEEAAKQQAAAAAAAQRKAAQKQAQAANAAKQSRKSGSGNGSGNTRSAAKSATRSSSAGPTSRAAAPSGGTGNSGYNWSAADGGQAAVDAGKMIQYGRAYGYNNYYAADIKTARGKQIRGLHVGDIVTINGRRVHIDGEIHDNYNGTMDSLVSRIPGYWSGNVACFQTCEPPYGGHIVIKYGHYI